MRDIILVGMSGISSDLIEELEFQGWTVKGYLDKSKQDNCQYSYLGDDETEVSLKKLITVAGLSSYSGLLFKKELYYKHQNACINLIFEGAKIGRNVDILQNANIVIFDFVSIKNSCAIGKNTFINTMTSIGHHTKIKGNTSISIGVMIGGNVTIGESCFIGMGTKIFPGVSIGDNCCIAANALVTKDVPENSYVSNKDDVKLLKIKELQS